MLFSKGTSLSGIELESLNVSAGGFFTTRATCISFCRRHLWLSYSESESPSVLSNSLSLHGLYTPWNSPGQNTGVGCLSLLQEIFPTQESNWDLLHCRWILLPAELSGRWVLLWSPFLYEEIRHKMVKILSYSDTRVNGRAGIWTQAFCCTAFRYSF